MFLFAPLLGWCLLADSTANHHSDVMMSANLLACQLYLRTRVDCVCVRHASVPCAPTRSAVCVRHQLSTDAQCILSYGVMLCVVRCDIYRFVLWLLICIEFFVEDNADARIGVSVLLCQVQS